MIGLVLVNLNGAALLYVEFEPGWKLLWVDVMIGMRR